ISTTIILLRWDAPAPGGARRHPHHYRRPLPVSYATSSTASPAARERTNVSQVGAHRGRWELCPFGHSSHLMSLKLPAAAGLALARSSAPHEQGRCTERAVRRRWRPSPGGVG